MIIAAILTFGTGVAFCSGLADECLVSHPQERVVSVRHLKVRLSSREPNRSGEQAFKKEQYVCEASVLQNDASRIHRMIEALLDPKTWLFALLSGLANVPKGLSNQSAVIIASIGFSILQTTLLGCFIGVIETVAIWTACVISSRVIIFVYYLPNIPGTILANTLPWTNKIGLLFSVWMIIISLSLISAIRQAYQAHYNQCYYADCIRLSLPLFPPT
ncbi:hypothetical protein B0H14DRAFT_2632422 [Mycena olivaceomarginata]|nr:hypothetical protein B0H14DRAFT_2632422 [Mycena olivaceomarginata]